MVEASRASDARARVGGPRALALSDRAVQMGVLPPPVCLEPKLARSHQQQQQPDREAEQENVREAVVATVERTPSKGAGGWRSEWNNLAADTGYNSTSTTPASTPNIGPAGSLRAANRCLSPVAEVDDRRSSVAGARDDSRTAAAGVAAARTGRGLVTPQLPPPLSTSTTPSNANSSWGRGRWAPAPGSQSSSSSYTYGTRAISGHHQHQHQQQQHPHHPTSHYSYSNNTSASIPRPPPPVASAQRGASPARMRLMRAQEALRVRGGRDTVVLLNRPQRLTGDGRRTPPGDPRLSALSAPDSRARPELFRMPGSFENEWETPTRA